MLDWSYRLLTDREKKVFRSLAVFSRWFSLSEANEIANDKSLTSAAIATTVGELVAKTLLSTTQIKMCTRYCLPGVTRTFARAKLSEEGEHDAACERHARHVLRAMQTPQTEGPIDDTADQMEDVRAALLWASSPGGDPALQDALARATTRRPD
jgi:predicted ATPase